MEQLFVSIRIVAGGNRTVNAGIENALPGSG